MAYVGSLRDIQNGRDKRLLTIRKWTKWWVLSVGIAWKIIEFLSLQIPVCSDIMYAYVEFSHNNSQY